MRRNYISVLFLAFLMFFSQACVLQKSPVTGKKRAYAYSWQQEVNLGREADGQIIEYFGLYEDEALTNYITGVGKKVLAESHMRRESTEPMFRDTPFTFRVLDSPVVNAFALPGGFNYVTRGLLTHMTSEAQLAMVIGHEIGHVAARHASQQALKQQAGTILLVGTAILGQEVLGLPGQQILDLGSSAAQLLFLSYSRDAERESDRLGVEYAAKAGYASAEGAAFFTTLKRLSDRAGQSIPSHLSSHPDPGEREKDIVNRAERWKERGLPQPNVMQSEFYGAIDGMMLGENPREGFTDGGFFYHPDMAFQFPVPDNFVVINERSQVVLVTRDQKAVTIFSLPGKDNTADAVDEIGNLEEVTIISREQLNINSETAHRIVGSMSDQNGNPFRINVTAVNNGGQIFRFLSYSSEADFSGFENAFNRVSSGFARLTDSNILAVQPARIRIVTANRTAEFMSFLPSTFPSGIDAEQLAIINQVELNETIPQGTLLKLPR